MYTLLVVLICIAAILMIGIVLIQESKGGGLSSSFASYNQIGGVRKTTDFIEKATWVLVCAMVVISIACAHFAPSASDASIVESIEVSETSSDVRPMFGTGQPEATEQPAPAAAETPAQPAN